MTDVLGSAESWKKELEGIASTYNKENNTNLKVIVSKPATLQKFLEHNYDINLPESTGFELKNMEEVAIQEEKRRALGLIKKDQTVVALEWPYISQCVVTADKKYEGLGKIIKDVVKKAERSAIYLSY